MTARRLSINIAEDTAAYLRTTHVALGITLTDLVRRCIALDKIVRDKLDAGTKIQFVAKNGETRELVIL